MVPGSRAEWYPWVREELSGIFDRGILSSVTDDMDAKEENRNASYVVSKMLADPPAEWVEARHDGHDPFLRCTWGRGSRRRVWKHWVLSKPRRLGERDEATDVYLPAEFRIGKP